MSQPGGNCPSCGAPVQFRWSGAAQTVCPFCRSILVRPSHERMINTLREWGISVDETFFLGGVEKARVLAIFSPHIFFDDQRVHLDTASGLVPSVHIPFGVKNH